MVSSGRLASETRTDQYFYPANAFIWKQNGMDRNPWDSAVQFKDELIKLAQSAERAGTAQFLNAGRGNPNWICTTPRDAFATLLRFGLEESRRGVSRPDLGHKIERSAGGANTFTQIATAAANTTACSSEMPTSKKRSGNRRAKPDSPVPDGIAAVIATMRSSASACLIKDLAKTLV